MWFSLRRWLRLFPVVCGVAATVACLTPPAYPITNGEIDKENEFANVGAIVLTKPVPNHPDFPEFATAPSVACSGTLIHPRVMLTAGHCTKQTTEAIAAGLITLDDIRVSFSPDAFDPKSWVEVADLITHPDFDKNTLDIGVVILKRPVKKVTPAPLPPAFLLDDLWESGELEGTFFPRAGYGQALAGVKPDGLRRFTASEFAKLTDDVLVLSADESKGEGGGWNHDSGSPIFWFDPESGALVPVAVFFTLNGNQDYGIRVDLPVTLDFLEDVLDAVELGLL